MPQAAIHSGIFGERRSEGACGCDLGGMPLGRGAHLATVAGLDVFRGWSEIPAQNRKTSRGVTISAHENVDGGKAMFGPCVDRDMGFRQKRHAGEPGPIAKIMEIDVKHHRPRHPCGAMKNGVDRGGIVEMIGPPEINQHVMAQRGGGRDLGHFVPQRKRAGHPRPFNAMEPMPGKQDRLSRL